MSAGNPRRVSEKISEFDFERLVTVFQGGGVGRVGSKQREQQE